MVRVYEIYSPVKELVTMRKYKDIFSTLEKSSNFLALRSRNKKAVKILYLFGNGSLCSLMHSYTHNFQRCFCNYRHHACKDC